MKGMMKSKAPMKMSADSDMDMMKKPRFGARAMRPGGMKKGGMVKKYAKGGGIEMKAKTKGKIV